MSRIPTNANRGAACSMWQDVLRVSFSPVSIVPRALPVGKVTERSERCSRGLRRMGACWHAKVTYLREYQGQPLASSSARETRLDRHSSSRPLVAADELGVVLCYVHDEWPGNNPSRNVVHTVVIKAKGKYPRTWRIGSPCLTLLV